MKLPFSLLLCALLCALQACKKEDIADLPSSELIDPWADEKNEIKSTYATLAFAVYDDAYSGAVVLQTAIHNFLDNPTEAGFDVCKSQWLAVREIYGLSETFRFAEGPIDNEADGPEGLINAWPMDEAYVDYVVGNPDAGIINHPEWYPNIDAVTLLAANENGGETNIALGFHAIEFLLWGQDLSANSAGMRPYTDYLTVGGTAGHADRRGAYLQVTADILVAGLKQVRDAWDPAISNNYRSTLLNQDSNAFLRDVFNSLKVLSGFELSGERIYVAYQNANQEDEHSCFSDNTHRDIHLNAQGMYNLFRGQYTRLDGTSIDAYSLGTLVESISPALHQATLLSFENSLQEIAEMYIPFDQAIVLETERPKVLEAVQALQLLDDQLSLTASGCFGIYF